jgi:uncharacterized membrane protein (UPF0127 family)
MDLYYNNNLLAKAKVCRSMFSRFRGLMFTKKLKPNTGILLVSDNENILKTSIHMLFVFYPIDILWLDKNLKIVDKKTIKPFTINHRPKSPAKYVLELPAGTAKFLSIGEKLKSNI